MLKIVETTNVVNKETNKGKEHNQDENNGLKKVQSALKYEDMKLARIEKSSVACLHCHKLGHTTTHYGEIKPNIISKRCSRQRSYLK